MRLDEFEQNIIKIISELRNPDKTHGLCPLITAYLSGKALQDFTKKHKPKGKRQKEFWFGSLDEKGKRDRVEVVSLWASKCIDDNTFLIF